MKLKKVLAATLAGTMVMASAATVFASETIVGDGWWVSGTYQTNEHSSEYTITGDGTWNIALTTAGYSGTGDDGVDWTVAPAFCVELISDIDGTTGYITSTCFADGWTVDAGDSVEITGVTSGGNGAATNTGDVWYITVTREGQDFSMEYYQNDTKVIKQSFSNTTFSEEASLHLIAQTGAFTAEITTDGSEPSVEAYTEEWDFASWAAEQDGTTVTADTEADSEDADSEAADSEDADSEAAESDDAATTSDSSDTAEESDGLSTGAIAAIVIVVIVVIAVIVVVATKKKK